MRPALFLLIGLAGSSAFASTTTSSLFGEVFDVATHKPVADAIVVATSPNLQGEQTELSDKEGRYRLSNLPPGDYTIIVTAPTYKSFELSGIALLVGREVRV